MKKENEKTGSYKKPLRMQAFTLAEGATHVDTCDKVRRGAFTLAEVLIVLAIIGVISVLTLPNVMQSYNKKVTVAQLQRTYNALRNGFQQYITDEKADSLDETGMLSNDNLKTRFFKKYLNVTKLCDVEQSEIDLTQRDDDGKPIDEINIQEIEMSKNAGNCLGQSYKGLMSNSVVSSFAIDSNADMGDMYRCAVLETGATVCMTGRNVRIDTNGVAAPNRLGIDLFEFRIDSQGKADILSVDSKNCNKSGTSELDQPNYCFAKIVQNGWVMDY